MNRPPLFRIARLTLLFLITLAAPTLTGCHASKSRVETAHPSDETAFLDDLEERSFRWFWDVSDSSTGLTPDRWPTRSFQSIAATGFALTAYPIGVERGWITRGQARRRVLDTLRFLWSAPQDSLSAGVIGYKGFFYHFLEPETGHRFQEVELSTIDTALLLAGAFTCQSWFDQAVPEEMEIRALTDSIYARVDWQWASVRPPLIGHGWKPESGHLGYDWRGYNEAMLVYLFALGSPTHPVVKEAWDGWISGYRWGRFQEQEHLGFAPLFGHQYSHVWIDFRGIKDDYIRERGIDYFENSRRATLAQYAYALANPGGFTGYGADLWGLTACDGPVSGLFPVQGQPVQFNTYWARGATFDEIRDDGTISPTAAGGSIAFAPEIVIPVLMSMKRIYGENLYSTYGFLDALNPTFRFETPVQHGRVIRGVGWFDTDYLGIDQGPILTMVENYRTELVWKAMRRNSHVRRGLKAAGFTGGWLDDAPAER
ncbi:MAG: glucoamylase family protein [Candidatus Eisenbacteria bacterium]|nr:glucoamylase family protein [Candidatus Eisenbacteria bacterium]